MADRARRDVSLRKGVLLFIFEYTVFPWQSFKGDVSLRRAAIRRNTFFAIVVPILALAGGHVRVAVLALAIFGGGVLFLIAANRRIEDTRRAERARRLRRTGASAPPS